MIDDLRLMIEASETFLTSIAQSSIFNPPDQAALSLRYLLLKCFSSSSSLIDSTTGRPCGHVNRSRVFDQSPIR